MGDMKKYTDIVRLGAKSTVGVLSEGDNIVVQEKLDGANASFRLVDGKIEAFSRNTKLDESNNLRGFYQWTQTLNPAELTPGVIYFGEWLVQHKIHYHETNMNQFYLFDIFDDDSKQYEWHEYVKSEAHRLGLNMVPIFYTGTYRGFEHLQSFVGRSELGDFGEGVVVKNVDYRDRFGNQMFVKLVSEAFAEVQKQKLPKDPNLPATPEQEFVSTYVTSARVDKFMHKLVDEGVLDNNFGIEDMGTILKHLNQRIYEDLLKEESDALPTDYDDKLLRKNIGRVLPTIVKSIISERESVLI